MKAEWMADTGACDIRVRRHTCQRLKSTSVPVPLCDLYVTGRQHDTAQPEVLSTETCSQAARWAADAARPRRRPDRGGGQTAAAARSGQMGPGVSDPGEQWVSAGPPCRPQTQSWAVQRPEWATIEG